MKKVTFCFVIIFALQFCNSAFAQEKPITGNVGLEFCNHNVYGGRDFGVSESSLSPSLWLQHKSGIYTAIGGSWLSKTEPHYALTTLSVGYSKTVGSWLTILGGYSRLFANKPDSVEVQPLSNVLSASVSANIKFLTISAGYSYLFGNETSNDINLGLTFNYSKEFEGFVSSLSILPGITTQIGNANSVFQELSITKYKNGVGKTIVRAVTGKGKGKGGTGSGTGTTTTVTENSFGILSYDFHLPVSILVKQFGFTMAAHYSIPHKLNSDETNLKNQVYFTIGTTLNF